MRPEEIAFYISGQLLTEDYYAVNKLAKGFLGTNNVDSNSRLCMSSAVAGYTGALGSDGPPPSYADIDEADVLFLVGSNAAACHPIVWNRMRSRGRVPDRRRPAPDADRRARRPAPAGAARAPTCRCSTRCCTCSSATGCSTRASSSATRAAPRTR